MNPSVNRDISREIGDPHSHSGKMAQPTMGFVFLLLPPVEILTRFFGQSRQKALREAWRCSLILTNTLDWRDEASRCELIFALGGTLTDPVLGFVRSINFSIVTQFKCYKVVHHGN